MNFLFAVTLQIAAQKKKNRPVSPESESNWDSSDAENSAPHISSDDDETSIVSSKSKGRTITLSKENNNCKLKSRWIELVQVIVQHVSKIF